MRQGFNVRPPVGREAVLEAVTDSLLRPGGHGAVVVADAGTGKSLLATAVAAKLKDRMDMHRIHTSSSLSAVPYGALAPLISDLDPRETDSPLAVMRSLMGRLFPDARYESATAPLLIVDDAESLDEASGDLVMQLVTSGRLRVLLLTRRIAGLPAGLSNLVWEGALSRHDLPPLTEAQVHELCVQVLDGPVLTSTSTDIARVSGGNPMLVLALLSESVRAESLVFRNGVWLLHEQMLPPEGRLGDLLRAQLSGLSAGERDALEIIALAEPLPAAAAFSLGLHRAVDSLTEAKLVDISGDPVRLLRLKHPLYGDVVRRLVPAARSARLRRRLLTVSDPGTEQGENLLRWVSWSLDCGADVPDSSLVAAAYRANNLFDSALAFRLATAVKDPAYAMAARVQAARARFQDGKPEAARELILGVSAAAADLTTLKMAVLIRVELIRLQPTDDGGLSAVAADWLAGVDRIEESAGENPDSELAADILSSRRGGRLLDLTGRIAEGRFGSAEEELRTILAAGLRAHDDEAVLIAKILLAEILTESGRLQAAYGLSHDALTLLDRGGHRFMAYYQFVLYRHLRVLVWLGKWKEISATIQVGVSGVFGALVHVAGAVDLTEAVMHLRTNDAKAALDRLTASVEGLRTSDSQGLLTLSMGLGAFIAASNGQPVLAEELLADAASCKPRGAATTRLLARGYEAAARMLLQPERQPGITLSELAEEAENAGFVSVELELRFLSLSLGDIEGLNRLQKIAEDFEGPQGSVLGRFARAVLDDDADELLLMGSDPVEPGWERLADPCIAAAQRIAKAKGDHALLQRVQRVLGKQRGGTGSGTKAGVPLLTRRERDVAALVMQGYRNAEIAERLFLSVRTVEGHIYRTFEKLGISKREELKQELLTRDASA
ncbi:helix-turn-helix transcriptional regulator [Arthrobacter sp. APC 3897]|uniref:helix-turn-helix domain-containing protein n=1 Tax=Arthrobacter sp. APC 3897 TaxID=3035204 RepID=UPI0025B3DFE8|nr:helix-turn-helix transcriptional regulator [Arthrobacter sp. APC 3897]MDN3483604.1 helix-turn-helix transcriptional regulator [Arthrobacter sp. APC 3897]